jgi:phosphonate transport system ATP-binding protein
MTLALADAAARNRQRPVRAAAPQHATAVDLAVRGLRKSYGGAAAVLDGIDLEVPHGQSVAIIGANGTGKSTLLRCCLRLVDYDAGSVRLFDTPLDTLRGAGLRRVRAGVGFVFQRHNLVSRLSALSNVVHGVQARSAGPRGWLQGFAARAVREEAMHCLDRVGLANIADRRVSHLSGGQSQRVAIARTLMQRPRLVFADEPVASLDPRAGEEVMELFVALMLSEQVTLVFTSHNLRHALAYAGRVVGLRGGRIVLDGPSRLQNPDLLRNLYD